MAQNLPRDHTWLLRRIEDLERRVREMETAPRAGNASISGGKLTVGEQNVSGRILVDAAAQRIQLTNNLGDAYLTAYDGDRGGALEAVTTTGEVLSFPTRAYVWAEGRKAQMYAARTDTPDTSAHVGTAVLDSGGGNAAGLVDVVAHSTSDPNGSYINMQADGGVRIYCYARGTDVPAPGADSAILYVKAGRLWVRDTAGGARAL